MCALLHLYTSKQANERRKELALTHTYTTTFNANIFFGKIKGCGHEHKFQTDIVLNRLYMYRSFARTRTRINDYLTANVFVRVCMFVYKLYIIF